MNYYMHNLAEIRKTQPDCSQCLIGENKIGRMFIKQLQSLFGDSESSTGRLDSAVPNVIEQKACIVIVPEKFREDIKNLQITVESS